ncbi:EAL domain-containing protein, partial [Salinivibrio kushneri]|uniref:EAL domain-containing protein n=1 Tax=Salinivibrio kushneri TaxID=1908198 RepID=UPI001056D00B
QLYSVASLMCSSAAISEMVLLFGGNNFLRIAAFLSSEYLGIVSSVSPPLLDFWAIQDLDNYPDTGGNSPMKNSGELIKLNNHGAKICLDDFGVCNSNLHRLMSLPIHLVKVDREVFWMTSHSEQNQSLLKGFIDSLRKNKIKIVCEGLETEGHYTEAEMLGFDYYQGFYFGMPMEINTEELNYEKCS